jgi:hypothetical protein
MRNYIYLFLYTLFLVVVIIGVKNEWNDMGSNEFVSLCRAKMQAHNLCELSKQLSIGWDRKESGQRMSIQSDQIYLI